MSKTNNDTDKEKVTAADLPLAEQLEDDYFAKRAVSLLEEAKPLKLRCDKDKSRLDEIQAELIAIARAHELPGLRHGQVALAYYGERSNRFLDKSLLIENGVSPELIAKCYKPTKEFSDARLVLLK